MIDLSGLGPQVFMGGAPSDYAVQVAAGGTVGTRHLPTGRFLPSCIATPGQPNPLIDPVGVPAQFGGGAGQLLQAAQPWLAAANLGVSVLNLGVSAWTAWQVGKLGKKIDGIGEQVAVVGGKVDALGGLLETSVQHLDHLISGNAALLGVVIENQERLAIGLAVIRTEMLSGFREVLQTLTSAEAKRESQELETQMRELHSYYDVCTRQLQAGRAPSHADLRAVIETATHLVSWLATRTAALPTGDSRRLPLLVARAFALRLEVEARSLLDDAPDSRQIEFERTRTMARDDLIAITDRSSVVERATVNRDLIERYVFLHRALIARATLVEVPDGCVVPCYAERVLRWDDGMETVRRAAALDGAPAPERLSLESLGEHRAVQRILGLPRGGTEDDVDRDRVARALGVAVPSEFSEHALRALLVASPDAIEAARERILVEVA